MVRKSKLLSWILPTEKRFFGMLEEHASKNIEAAKALTELSKDLSDIKEKVERLTEMEHAGDDMRHKIIEELNKTFITPIDREDIFAISDLLDDILDYIEGTSTRMYLYEVKKIPEHVVELAQTLVMATENVAYAINDMSNGFKDFQGHHRRIHELENEGDRIQRKAIAEIFKTPDAIRIIKWKEIIETLESAIDACEDVADIIDDVRMKFT